MNTGSVSAEVTPREKEEDVSSSELNNIVDEIHTTEHSDDDETRGRSNSQPERMGVGAASSDITEALVRAKHQHKKQTPSGRHSLSAANLQRAVAREEEKQRLPPESQSTFDLREFRKDEGVRLVKPWGVVAEPEHAAVLVRGVAYMHNSKKVSSQSILLPLVEAEAWRISRRIDHLAAQPLKSWYQQHVDPKDTSVFVIILHLQVPSINCSVVHYHVLEGGLPAQTKDKVFNRLFMRVVDDPATFGKDRLKLIPRIVTGPYVVRHMVKNKPCILGNRVKHRYFRGPNYLEIDAEVDESYISASIIKLCHGSSTSMVVDMCWVIEGRNTRELPERIMLGVRFHNFDFAKSQPLEKLRPEHRLWQLRSPSHCNGGAADSQTMSSSYTTDLSEEKTDESRTGVGRKS